MTVAEVERVMRDLLAESLDQDLDDVVAEANFFHDLDGESIDFIDLGFRVNKAFGCDIRLLDMISTSGLDVDEEGRLTPASRSRLRTRAPYLGERLASSDVSPRPSDLVTVGAITAFVIHELTNAGQLPTT